MKAKKVYSLLLIASAIALLVGCSSSKTSTDKEGSSTSTSSITTEEKETEVYVGTVKAKTEQDTNQLLLGNLDPEDSESDSISFGEVVLLTEGVKITNRAGEKVAVEEIDVGTQVEVTLRVNSPVANSLPPQIPGDSIIEIIVS